MRNRLLRLWRLIRRIDRFLRCNPQPVTNLTPTMQWPRWALPCRLAAYMFCLTLSPHMFPSPAAVVPINLDQPARRFDLPSDLAIQTFKLFSQQAEVQLLFPTDLVKDIRTQAVHGVVTPRQALEQMIAGTPLVVVCDERTGALGIKRPPAVAGREDEPLKENEPHKIAGRRNPMGVLAGFIALVFAPFNQAGAAEAADNQTARLSSGEESAVVLSPFEVRTDKDVGYVAANSLAGSRMNAALQDTPASISVMTREFLDDIGAVNVTKAMEYATAGGNDIGSGDVGGTTGNYLIEKDYNFMIRGYREVQLTRDFFPTTLDGDSFNLDRIDISRGPNSILFGVGGAGGIVNFTPKRAETNRNASELLLRLASWDSTREAIDVNQVLLKERLAVRLNLMNQYAGGYQDFVTDNQKRGALALTWRPTDTTTIRVDTEFGKLHQNRARPWLPFEQVSNWRDNGQFYFPYGTPQYPSTPADNNFTQWSNLPGGSTLLRTAGYIIGTTPAFTDGPLAGEVVWARTSAQGGRYYRTSFGYGATGFNSAFNFPDGSLPRTLNISGSGAFVEKKYGTIGATIEQKLAPDLYLQAAVNHSNNRQLNRIPMGFASIALALDVTTTVPSFNADRSYNATGPQPGQGTGALNFNVSIPNPYVGSYLAMYHPYYVKSDFVNDDYRLSLTYHLDLGVAGNHNFLAFASRSEADREDRSYTERNVDPNRPAGPNSRYDSSSNFSVRVSHIDPFSGSLTERGVPDPWTHPLPSGPIFGDPAHSFTDGWINDDWEKSKSTINTLALAMQSGFLKNSLVTTAGVRRDKLKINNYDGNWDDLGVAMAPTPSSTGVVNESATTYTLGAVYRLPVLKGVSIFANKSTNFQDQPGDVLFGDEGQQSPVGPIKGDGRDYGFKFDFLDNRINATLAWFKVDEANVASGFDGNIYNYTSAIWRTIANGGPNGDLTDTHKAGGDDTRAQVSKGVELEVTANPTKNWRVTFNITKATNVLSGLDTHVLAYVNAHRTEWQSHSALAYDTGQSPGYLSNAGGTNTIGALITGLDELIAVDKQQEGQIETNLRQWNANAFTAYHFDSGFLNGLTVGGGVNYRGPEILGRNPNTHEMFSGHPYYLVNGMLGYDFKWKKVNVRVQLNADNLFNNKDQQVLASAWNSTTNTLNRFYYYFLPRNYSLTTTVRF